MRLQPHEPLGCFAALELHEARRARGMEHALHVRVLGVLRPGDVGQYLHLGPLPSLELSNVHGQTELSPLDLAGGDRGGSVVWRQNPGNGKHFSHKPHNKGAFTMKYMNISMDEATDLFRELYPIYMASMGTEINESAGFRERREEKKRQKMD